MKLHGRRIHIVGSAAPDADEGKLSYAHTLVSQLVAILATEGASFVLPFGKEPFLKDHEDGPSIIFDWTVAQAVRDALVRGDAQASGPSGKLVATLATTKTDAHIPNTRRSIYDELRDTGAIYLEFMEPGWTAGASRRRRLAELGDVLIGLSGGEGVEHLAIEYSSRGKPVIPLDLQLGASQRDGSGGAARLFERALAQPRDFLRVIDGDSAADLLDRTRTRNGETPSERVVPAIVKLLHALTPPRVFYVRMLNDKLPEYPSVERYFRETVDQVVKKLGYEPSQMGVGKNEFSWMNQAIFDQLHHSSIVFVDLTTLRPNCFMEFGYALGNRQKVIISARDDTHLPFDSSSLETFLWKEAEPSGERAKRLRQHWERNINMPAIVRPKEAR